MARNNGEQSAREIRGSLVEDLAQPFRTPPANMQRVATVQVIEDSQRIDSRPAAVVPSHKPTPINTDQRFPQQAGEGEEFVLYRVRVERDGEGNAIPNPGGPKNTILVSIQTGYGTTKPNIECAEFRKINSADVEATNQQMAGLGLEPVRVIGRIRSITSKKDLKPKG
ncbi:MAG: hypothetical protein AB7G06_02710 [Bdellovibrionales bacterium]